MKRVFSILTIISFLLGSVFLPYTSKVAAAEDESASIKVTTIEEDGNSVEGSPTITAVPVEGKPVESIMFSAKAFNEPDTNYYPYAPKSSAPFDWSWPTGEPWVPDGKYSLKMDITYQSGDKEVVEREIFVDNYTEPKGPAAPTDLNVSDRTSSSATLSWTASTSDKFFEYVVYQNGTEVGVTKDTSYEVTGLTSGDTYSLSVKTKDIYDNQSLHQGTIEVVIPTDDNSEAPLPVISEIQAPEPNGATPGEGGFSGTINLSVNADVNVEKVDFFVKTVEAPDSAYWKFPGTTKDGDSYTTSWLTTSAPEDGKAIIKAVATDSNGQSKTVTRVFLIDNEGPATELPSWDPADTPPANHIVGYLAGWSQSFDILTDLDASRLTHLNYAFGKISNDFEIFTDNPTQDQKNYEKLQAVKEEHPHFKTLIAIGGWGGSANFSEASATEETRTMFANNAVEYMIENGFDGVDLDWEYPVTGGGPGTTPNADDKENYPKLLETLREKLDEQGEKDGKHYLLTIAGAANTGFINNATLGETHQYLDYVQVMTYDIHGSWEAVADFNAPLYDDNGKTWSVDKAIQAYLDAGVPAEKLIMGTPFYGYRYNVTSSENNGLRQPFGASGSMTYNRFIEDDYLNNGYTRYWDEGTKTPYLFNEEESIFITYDDKESIAIKADYIREEGLGGAMIWEITQDHGNDLLSTLYTGLKDPIDRSDDETGSEADKVELASTIQTAGNLTKDIEVGTAPGQYPQTAVDALNAAIAVAQDVLDNENATQEEVNDASAALNEALITFEESVIPESNQLPDPDTDEPTSKQIKVGETTEVVAGSEISIEGSNTRVMLPADLPIGTTLTVRAVNETVKGLEKAGDVYEFDFIYPNGEDFNGKFTLVLDYDETNYSSNEVSIYYHNEVNDKWEHRGGQVGNGTITLEVPHFSTYGVFTEITSDESNGSQDDEDQGNTNQNELPDTASSMYNWIVIGLFLISIGAIFVMISIRKKINLFN
ncbi:glycosyl hydrolase family 18 protein [Radiobacillus sp. PE A8.2]|uniref:glycosyl hydrolase family 18 protein n=1 Tax=Radiobacillus sp. PE A8.2 TaxID=3380349 RepID=UPI00388F5C80